MNFKELKDGFYWVTYLGEEQIAQYCNGYFLVVGCGSTHYIEEMDEINERVERIKE